MRASHPFRIGILGQGTVGSEVIDQLNSSGVSLQQRAGKPIVLEAIHRRHPERAGEFYRSNPHYFRSIDDIVSDPSIDLVCELMGDVVAARHAISCALQNRKHVVTANKALLAEELPRFVEQAKQGDVQIRFEAAVAGGIPILTCIRCISTTKNIQRVRGIINGTTNFVLSRMQQGTSYTDALAEAQRLGYAEADPSSDVLGHDASQKLSILIACAFGKRIPSSHIHTRGISEISEQDMESAAALRCVIKLIACAEEVHGKVIARVGPELVPQDSLLGRVSANLNAIEVSNKHGSINYYQGEGAGGKPTAASVLTDIITIAQTDELGYISPFGNAT